MFIKRSLNTKTEISGDGPESSISKKLPVQLSNIDSESQLTRKNNKIIESVVCAIGKYLKNKFNDC